MSVEHVRSDGFHITEDGADGPWDDCVRGCGGTVFHSNVWAQYVLRRYAQTTAHRFRLLDAAGRTIGTALGFRTQSRHALMKPITRRLRFDALPAVSGKEQTAKVFALLLERHARESRDVAIEFGSFGCRGGADVLQEFGYALKHRLEFELDLSPSEDALWRAIEYQRRKNVNKARRLGVVVEELPADIGLPILYRLHELTWDRVALRGVERGASLGAGVAAWPEHVLLEAGVGRLMGARIDDEWLTVSLFTHFAGQVYHVLSGHSPRAMTVQAPTLALWESVLRFRTDGAKWFNFGGIAASARDPSSPEHGVMEYKRAFGGTCLECASGVKVIRPTRARIARLLGRDIAQ